MFGASRKKTSGTDEESRLAEWQRSPSVPVKKATGLKTRLLLENIGRELKVMYRNEPYVIRPLSIFRKPAYNRMYVEAEYEGEPKVFNIADLMIRRPDSDSYFDDEETVAKSSAIPLLGLLLVLVLAGAAVAYFMGAIPFDIAKQVEERLNLPAAPVAPPVEQTDDVVPPSEPPVAELPAQETTTPPSTKHPLPLPTSPATKEGTPPTVAGDSSFGREFSDSTGGFRIRAEFVEFQPDRGRGSRVILRKADSTEVDVAMNRLSKEDQAWIREEVKRRKM